jgi:chromosome segregation ATPase
MCASKPMKSAFAWRVLALSMAVLATVGQAHAEGDREQEQLRRLKLQLRQTQQEKDTALQEAQTKAEADKAALAESLKAIKGDADSQRRVASSASRRADALAAELAAVKKDKDQANEQIAQLQKALDEAKALMTQQQQQSSQTVADWQGRFKSLSGQYDQCRTQNASLYEIGADLLTRYENKGLGEMLATKEPFVQTARVTLENTKAQYLDKLDAARLKTSTP